MRSFLRFRNPFGSFFARSRREAHLERYVLREYRQGRALAEILEDPYMRAWSTPEERTSMLDRPNVVAAIGEHAVSDLRATIAAGQAAV